MPRMAVELRAVGAGKRGGVAGELDDRHLHAETDAEVGDPALPGEARGLDLALDPARSEAPRGEHAIHPFERRAPVALDLLRVDELHPDPGPSRDPGMDEGLVERLVGVREMDVLADHPHDHLPVGVVEPGDHLVPLREVDGPPLRVEPQPLHGHRVDALLVVEPRQAVDGVDVRGREHRARLDVGEQGNLAPLLFGQRAIGATQKQVGLDSDGPELLHRVLGGLGLDLAGGGDVGHEGEVDEQGPGPSEIESHLADGLEERERLDVAHRAADLHHGDVGPLRARCDARLDLVGDVGDHLHGAPEIVPPALAPDHALVDLAGREVVVPTHRSADEPLVVAEVEVGLGPVAGHVHLPVLEGVHGARIDVDVGVELDEGDAKAVRLEEGAERGGGDAFAERRDHATRDEYVSRHVDPIPPDGTSA